MREGINGLCRGRPLCLPVIIMSKIRIYIEPSQVNDFIKITGMGVVHKIKHVLRMNEGDSVFVFDGAGKEYSCTIKYIQSDSVLLRLCDVSREKARERHAITLVFPLTREDKVDLILQKCTELGATALIPFEANRGIKVRPSPAKMERWGNIIKEACRQSERLWLPRLRPPARLDEILSGAYDKKIFADIAGTTFEAALSTVGHTGCVQPVNILLVVGPEGDFSPEEKQSLIAAGCVAVNIGENILRVETAAIFLCGLTSYFLHNR